MHCLGPQNRGTERGKRDEAREERLRWRYAYHLFSGLEMRDVRPAHIKHATDDSVPIGCDRQSGTGTNTLPEGYIFGRNELKLVERSNVSSRRERRHHAAP